MSVKRNGGIWFWRIGRLGGSFYVARPRWKEWNHFRGWRGEGA